MLAKLRRFVRSSAANVCIIPAPRTRGDYCASEHFIKMKSAYSGCTGC